MSGNDTVFLPMIGRVLLGIFFMYLAVSHAMHWRTRTENLRKKNVLMPTLLLWVGIIVYFLCGFFLIFKFAIGTIVTILAIAVIIRAVILGNFWSKKTEDQLEARLQFMTNIALLGALLMAL